MTGAPLPFSLSLGTVAFLLGVIWGGPFIEVLRRLKLGKNIRAELGESHQKKRGTPTMGGIMIVIPVITLSVAVNLARVVQTGSGASIFLPLVVMFGFAILGLLDDWSGIQKSRGIEGEGLSIRTKFRIQLALAISVAMLISLYEGGFQYANQLIVPLIGITIPIHPIFFIPLTVFYMTATANAVNFTDGLDGLAGIISASAFAAYGIITFLQGQFFLTQLCFVLVGACFAFLWFNAFPAQLIMGDTGSMALGATLGIVAIMSGQWLLLPVIAIVPLAETISVILQIWYFRWTKGGRLFRIAPLHHHFERTGWSETQIVQRFWLVGILSAMIGVALALL